MPQPAGPGGAPPSGTAAIGLVARVWNRLSTAQQAAIDRRLGAQHDASSPLLARAAADQVLTPDAHYQALAQKYVAIYRARLPGTPPVTVKAFKASQEITDAKGVGAYADALPVNANGEWGAGPPAYCRIRVPPAGQAAGSQFQELVLAHEAFHCIHFAINPNWPSQGLWIREGMADWAALTVDPVPASVGGGNYRAYLSTASSPLFSRAYDGVGFWGHADEVGGKGSLWAKIPGILRAGDNAGSYAAAGGSTAQFVETWASGVWRFPAAGPAWTQTNPYSLGFNDPTLPFDAVTDTALLRSAPYALKEYSVIGNPDRPLVELAGHGDVRAGTPQHDFGLPISPMVAFGKCECPPDEDSSNIPPHATIDNAALNLAVTGGASPAEGQATYHSLDEFCQAKRLSRPRVAAVGEAGRSGPEVRGLTSGSPLLGRITTGLCSFVGTGFRPRAAAAGTASRCRSPGRGGRARTRSPTTTPGPT